MEVLHFAFGVCFDVPDIKGDITPQQFWEEIFSVLTVSDVKGLHVLGGMVSAATYASQDPCYICAFTNGSLKQMRRIYKKLSADAGVGMYLTTTRPYLESNALEKIDGLTFFGKVERDGTLCGAQEELYGLRFSKRRGKRSHAGKGIVFLLAPDSVGELITSKQVIRRLTIAARRHFSGVKIQPFPIAYGEAGTVDALLTAGCGTERTIQVKGPGAEKIDAHYAVLYGSTAVVEMPKEFEQATAPCSSFGIGEIIRRALDEGLNEIIISDSKSQIGDYGLGCLRALGIKLLDEQGQELSGGREDIDRLSSIDLELVHSRLQEVKFTLMTNDLNVLNRKNIISHALELTQAENKSRSKNLDLFCELVPALLKTVGDMPGLHTLLVPALRADCRPSVDALLDAVHFESYLKRASLVITGEAQKGILTDGHQGPAIKTIVERCKNTKTPCIQFFGVDVEQGQDEKVKREAYSMLTTLYIAATKEGNREKAIALIDNFADRLFRIIRIGRELS
ncbi:glycerate kinase [Eubacteriales bacterium OttesenSCG-928-K08]|nr:glycerate kinase [Eubacteriales bacterium OttesenSCG-928-K08]